MTDISSSSQRNLWFSLLSILAVYIGSNILLRIIFEDLEAIYYPDFFNFIAYAGSFLISIVYATTLRGGWAVTLPSFRFEKWNVSPLLIVAGLILMFATSIVLSPLLEMMPERYMDTLDEYMVGGFWPMLTAVVAAPILEEFLFRGIIQKNLVNRMGPILGIIFSSLIFGMMHIIPQQIIYASCLSLILGSIYYLTGSLNSAIAVHFVNNGLTFLLYMVFGSSRGIEQKIFGDGVMWNYAYGISVILLLGAAWYVIHQVRQEQKRDSSDGKSE